MFVADTDHKFNQSDAIRPVLTHSRLGVGVMLRAPRAAKRFKNAALRGAGTGHPHRDIERGNARFVCGADPRTGRFNYHGAAEKKTASSLKLPALCAAAEATGPEAMRSMTSWAGWILTAALLHPDSSALWEYTSFLPHYGLHRAPLAIRVLPLPEETEQPPAPPHGGPGSGGNAEGQLCLAQSARGAGKRCPPRSASAPWPTRRGP